MTKKEEQDRHKRVLALCKAIRESFPGAVIVYTQGQCFGFYLILKAAFPEAVAYHTTNHVYAKIGDRFYDVYGSLPEGQRGDAGEPRIKMTPEELESWDAVRHGKSADMILLREQNDYRTAGCTST
jgi:hypothetical protein